MRHLATTDIITLGIALRVIKIIVLNVSLRDVKVVLQGHVQSVWRNVKAVANYAAESVAFLCNVRGEDVQNHHIVIVVLMVSSMMSKRVKNVIANIALIVDTRNGLQISVLARIVNFC